MDAAFAYLRYLIFGFFGLLALLLLLALVFGKRVRKRWEFEAEFRDMGEREFGEFEIELSRIEKEEADYSFKAKFHMRHESLEKGTRVEIFLDDILVMQGTVTRSGRIFLRDKSVMSVVEEPRAGQVCRVVWSGIEQFRAPIRPD